MSVRGRAMHERKLVKTQSNSPLRGLSDRPTKDVIWPSGWPTAYPRTEPQLGGEAAYMRRSVA